MNKFSTNIESNLDKVKEWANQGCTESEIAKRLNVSIGMLNKYKNKYPELAMALLGKRSELLLKNALFKRACGYTSVEETSELKEMKQDRDMVITKRVLKDVPPDITAAKWWLQFFCKDENPTDDMEMALRLLIEKEQNFDEGYE